MRRRVVVALLVVVSLARVTGYFRESEDGPLHDAQGVAAAVLRPFQVGAERVARPFRDAYGYFAGLFEAKSEVERLRRQVGQLQQQAIQNRFAARERETLRGLLDYQGAATFPRDYESISAEVIGQAASPYEQEITIAAGSRDGVRDNSAVVTPEGLVGRVTRVTPYTSLVTLLTNADNGVAAVVRGKARGLLGRGQGGSDSLVLNRVQKNKVVRRGDEVVTAGFRLGRLTSIYPKGIQIGLVTSVSQRDTDPFKRIQVAPYVDFSSLDAVVVLVPKRG